MTTLWQTRWASFATQVGGALLAVLRYFSEPTHLRRLQSAIGAILGFWLLLSLWTAMWSFFPEADPLPSAKVINPVSSSSASRAQVSVDIDALAESQLFGQPGEAVTPDLLAAAGRATAMSEAQARVALAGIEEGAPDTRLPLVLRGVLAASEAGLGQAVIEHRKTQDLYQVGDDLPLSGDVVLAKVLSKLVVLDNGGRYEVLRLFEDSDLLSTAAVPAPSPSISSKATDSTVRTVAAGADAAVIATDYRARLYNDPQSLAEVVRVEPVRDGAQLQGYRISPGSAATEFAALGFKAGDLVTAVNGLSFTDPANTVRLYQAMRSAREASFELLRKGESVTLNVSLETSTGEDDS